MNCGSSLSFSLSVCVTLSPSPSRLIIGRSIMSIFVHKSALVFSVRTECKQIRIIHFSLLRLCRPEGCAATLKLKSWRLNTQTH